VQIGGVNVRDSAPPVLRRRIGHVFQGGSLFPHMTVAANIAIGLQIAGTRENAARVDELLDLGSAVIFCAVSTDQVDIYVDYTGTLWTNEMKRAGNPPRAALGAEVTAWTKTQHGVTTLGTLGFENAYVLAMPGEAARQEYCQHL
jgi:glycine betaine/choline ABC-type transport system substrate-binding protein